MFSVNRNPTPKDLRNFGWAMLAGFGVIAALLSLAAWRSTEGATLSAWSGSGRQIAAVLLLGLGVVLFLVSRVSLGLTKPLYIAWMSATVPIGIAMSTVLLSALFIGLLPLFAFIVRLGDPLGRRTRGATYWRAYPGHKPTIERMARMF